MVSLDPDVPRRGTLVLAPGDLGISARSVDLVDEVSGAALTWSQTLPVHLAPGWDVAAIYTSPAPFPLRSACEHWDRAGQRADLRRGVGARRRPRTCEAWLDNLRANREAAIAAAGEEAYAQHERAKAAGVRAYAERFTTLLRISFD
ncbi:hypothetical protein HW126_14390 [Salinispora sp. H7-4]|nr:hypothetical protein [Salinispora sp. H7-4]NYT94971.1 hypothetical protein [Salinispora sp. H7-4]